MSFVVSLFIATCTKRGCEHSFMRIPPTLSPTYVPDGSPPFRTGIPSVRLILHYHALRIWLRLDFPITVNAPWYVRIRPTASSTYVYVLYGDLYPIRLKFLQRSTSMIYITVCIVLIFSKRNDYCSWNYVESENNSLWNILLELGRKQKAILFL